MVKFQKRLIATVVSKICYVEVKVKTKHKLEWSIGNLTCRASHRVAHNHKLNHDGGCLTTQRVFIKHLNFGIFVVILKSYDLKL